MRWEKIVRENSQMSISYKLLPSLQKIGNLFSLIDCQHQTRTGHLRLFWIFVKWICYFSCSIKWVWLELFLNWEWPGSNFAKYTAVPQTPNGQLCIKHTNWPRLLAGGCNVRKNWETSLPEKRRVLGEQCTKHAEYAGNRVTNFTKRWDAFS